MAWNRTAERWLASLRKLWAEPVDPVGLGAFRFLFGLVALVGALRFWGLGWIESQYLEPAFHFTYPGFRWVRPWPEALMYGHFAVLTLAALGLCLGWHTRACALLYFLTFTYAELIEQSTYLNHYYLVSLLSFLLIFLPSGASLSMDAWRRARLDLPPVVVSRGSYWVLRAQMSVVYLSAGLAKLGADWLLEAQPLSLWLSQRAHLPVVGPLLALPVTAYVMSWAGMLYDCSVWLFLSLKATRRYAYAAAILFHVSVWLLFPIGMFSWIMLVATTCFFEPSWPRRLLPPSFVARHGPELPPRATDGRPRPLAIVGALLFLAVQAALPFRHFLYPGAVNWHEQGFRFSWRVMLIEKAGQIEYDVRLENGQQLVVYPRAHLSDFQYKMMSTQPDMILQYARHLGRLHGKPGRPARVYARAFASLNGRPSQRLIEPGVDLAQPSLPAHWIVPLGGEPRTQSPPRPPPATATAAPPTVE